MSELMSTRFLQQEIQTQLDEAFREVFGMMMGIACAPTDQAPALDGETVTAVVGMAGALSGACVLRTRGEVALHLAELLSGTRMDALDDMVKDAVGEICNMLAGAWKGKFPEIASACMLSVPAVVTGTDYCLHLQRPEFQLDRSYLCGGQSISFSIICERLS